MSGRVLESLNEVTAAWLTTALAQSDALTRGEVAGLALERGEGNWSQSARIAVRYSAGAQGALPQRLFLKLVDTDLDDEFFGPSEVTYYTRDYVGVEGAPLLTCYDAAYSDEKRRYHLLLDDVSGTHVPASTRTPTLTYGRALAQGLAALHAHWWGGQRLAAAGAPPPSAAHIRRFVTIAAPGIEHILGRFTAKLAPHWPETMRTLFARHPQAMVARSGDTNGFALIHGDVGHGNVLVPRQGDRPLYIIDRQPFDWSLTTWLGVYDLAYAMVLDWEIETRRRLEIPVLEHYHEHLLRRGVEGYAWDRLYDDYRLCVAMGVYVATEYCRGGVNERWLPVWLPMLQRALTACDDLACAELWQRGT